MNPSFVHLLQMSFAYAFFSLASKGTKRVLSKSSISESTKSLLAFSIGVGFVTTVFFLYFGILRNIWPF